MGGHGSCHVPYIPTSRVTGVACVPPMYTVPTAPNRRLSANLPSGDTCLTASRPYGTSTAVQVVVILDDQSSIGSEHRITLTFPFVQSTTYFVNFYDTHHPLSYNITCNSVNG